MEKSNGVDYMDWARAPPEAGPFWQRVGKVLYDPTDNSFLGRTPKRWVIMLAFYSVFYAVLAVMFSLCMGGLFLSLQEGKPKFTLEESLIGANPGVAFRPRPKDGMVVRYSMDNTSLINYYVDQMNEFVKHYENDSFYLSQGSCNSADNFGMPESPCFYIKLNRIYGWKPEFYDGTTDMPEDLASHIASLDASERQQIWISCAEEKANTTKLEYPWGRGLPGRYYPFLNVPGYLSPVIAVRVFPPVNTLVTIRCRTWAKNIVLNKSIKEFSGYTRIQLYLEDNTQAKGE